MTADAVVAVGSGLTDGTGIARLTKSKVLKDLVADFLLSGASSLTVVQVFSLQDVVGAPEVTAFALGGSLIRVLYRAGLKWSTS